MHYEILFNSLLTMEKIDNVVAIKALETLHQTLIYYKKAVQTL